MREEVERRERLVDINDLPLRDVWIEGDDLVIGALARMAEVAAPRRSLIGTRPLSGNGYKVTLLPRVIIRALQMA